MEFPKKQQQELVIDVFAILKAVWKRLWLVVLVALVTGVIAFSYASFGIAPTYSASVMLYINNNSVSLGDVGFSVTYSDLAASQSLVKTYAVLLKNRTTLQQVLKKSGLQDKYTYQALDAMITPEAVYETEVMRITVTSTSAEDATTLANCIADVLPQRVEKIIDGTSVSLVDKAVINTDKVAPSITKYTAIGLVVGVMATVILIALQVILDNTIHDEDYVLQTYNLPVLARVPDLHEDLVGGYANSRYGYGYEKSGQTESK